MPTDGRPVGVRICRECCLDGFSTQLHRWRMLAIIQSSSNIRDQVCQLTEFNVIHMATTTEHHANMDIAHRTYRTYTVLIVRPTGGIVSVFFSQRKH